ncbi:MAG TPA: arylesterase [Vicinamibacterales bacterium]|nr:arylesterase [Vicinamibacterales bacterium]
MLLTLISASALAAAPSSRTLDRPRVVAFGDSLTSGRGIGTAQAFPAILQQRIERDGFDYRVVNAGVSGDTSSRAIHRLDAALDGDVRVLILALGANDGLRGTPVAQLKANLGAMIEKAQQRGITVLLCGMEALPIYGWDYSVAFHNAYRELAKQYGVTLVPFILMNVIGNPDLMQPDHAHPNAAGARAIADNVWPYLEAVLQKDASPSPAR